MPNCLLTSCPNNSGKNDGVSYFTFPRNRIRCYEWTAFIAKARNETYFKPCKGAVICSYHFAPSDIYTTTQGLTMLDIKAKPIFYLNGKQLGNNDNSDQDNTHDNSDDDNNKQRIEKNEESIELSLNIDNKHGNNQEIRHKSNIVCLQGDHSRKIEQSPSTSLGIGSTLDTIRITNMQKKLDKCKKTIKNKTRQIEALQKRNRRLMNKNTTLKNTLKQLQHLFQDD